VGSNFVHLLISNVLGSNPYHQCGMHGDVPRVVSDIRKQGAKIAIVSRNTSKSM